jgi:hypothetical protein
MQQSDLSEIREKFAPDEFSYEPKIYIRYINELLALGSPPTELMAGYFDLLDDMMTMLKNCDLPATCRGEDCHLSSEARQGVFNVVAKCWDRNDDPFVTASMVIVASFLIPHAGVREWLLSRANESSGDLADNLSETATVDRKEFLV